MPWVNSVRFCEALSIWLFCPNYGFTTPSSSAATFRFGVVIIIPAFTQVYLILFQRPFGYGSGHGLHRCHHRELCIDVELGHRGRAR
jgi:hypothetical protein